MTVNSKQLMDNGYWECSKPTASELREPALHTEYQIAASNGWPPVAPAATHDELQMMHDSVLLPMAYRIVEKKLTEIESRARSLRPLFVKATTIVLTQMREDLAVIKQTLAQAGIVVHEEEQAEGIILFRYTCRGNNGGFAVTREYARQNINSLISKYINGIFRK
ncbi:hypothetical protein [Paenibacillus radicis (ex Gao et al. 2016)]|uniref:Uncharacterized protein n=1 Tax=Paenibacillus radicis (ex Gao et al. 2016) TaxID=1737354 RepID=A0A917LSR0_9BACL|nr:hypothetical protein [Paenibacillus radicis (ex Gao et al. 2016)]GGG54495.1 hypothetical protein GCM10010918_04120 [Paenibacillus radicis (ex Gao et al. 2016)]